jgi:Na+-translocating ferredoxin:NAD+ oxidoreductase RnfG subunit
VIRLVILLALVACLSGLMAGCSEPTQKEAQDSQEQIKKEMKESGDDKNAY